MVEEEQGNQKKFAIKTDNLLTEISYSQATKMASETRFDKGLSVKYVNI